MTHRILSALGAALLLAACKETPPTIDYGVKAPDTAYTAPVEQPQDRIVVIEEFTGVKCPPCPQGHVVLAAIEAQYPNRVVIVGIQPFGPPQTKPLDLASDGVATRHDNRTEKGTDIANTIYGGLSSIPIAGIDRTVVGSSRLVDRNGWVTAVDARIGVPTPANVHISSSYDASSGKADIGVKVAYTSAVTNAQSLTVVIVEDSVIDGQEGGPGGKNQDYVHMHVLRDILTASTGSVILSSHATKQPGLVYERNFSYLLNPDWNPEHCRIIAYVSNNESDNKEVVQGAEAHLK